MARNYPANTQIQKFLEESYNKERDTRLQWYAKGVATGKEQTQSKQTDVFRKKVEAACPKPTDALMQLRSVKPRTFHKRIMPYNDVAMVPSGADSASLISVDMVPVDLRTRDRLYDGFTKEGKGRYQYLQSRYQRIPEDKFHFPILSSWEYGWRLADVIEKEDIKKPDNGRTRIVANTFYTRTGIPALQCQATF